jgi:hypothetical protein
MITRLIEAFRAKQSGAITRDDCIDALLTRCTDTTRQEFSAEEEFELEQIDAFTHDVWMWTKQMDPIGHADPLEAVFLAYRHESFQEVERKFALLEATIRDLHVLSEG